MEPQPTSEDTQEKSPAPEMTDKRRRVLLQLLTKELKRLEQEKSSELDLQEAIAGTYRPYWLLRDKGKDPDKMSEAELKTYFEDLKVNQGILIEEVKNIVAALSKKVSVEPQEDVQKWRLSVAEALTGTPVSDKSTQDAVAESY